MTFELHTNEHASSHLELDGVTINKKGYIYFNGGFRRKYRPLEFKTVGLYQDNDKKLIAIKFLNTDKDTHSTTVRKNGGGGSISSASFVRLAIEYGYPTGVNLSVTELPEGLIAINRVTPPPQSNTKQEGK